MRSQIFETLEVAKFYKYSHRSWEFDPIGIRDRVMNSPTMKHVLAFSERMEEKLEMNRHKGDREGWLKEDIEFFLRRIKQETEEVRKLIVNKLGTFDLDSVTAEDVRDIQKECADVANFCMMLADKVEEDYKNNA